MHNLKGKSAAVLDSFSGLITLAKPEDVPEGGSPRNQNMDFQLGSAFTRPGLKRTLAAAGGTAGPSPGGTASSTLDQFGVAWQNPLNVLLNDGSFASDALCAATSLEANQGKYLAQRGGSVSTGRWAYQQNIQSSSGYAYIALDPPYASATLVIEEITASIPASATILGVVVTGEVYCQSSSTPPSFSMTFGQSTLSGPPVTTTPTPFSLGSASMDSWGIGWTPTTLAVGAGLSIVPGGGPNTLFLGNVQVVVYFASNTGAALQISEMGFNLPSSATPLSFIVEAFGYAANGAGSYPVTCLIGAQLLVGGVPQGDIVSVAMPSASGAMTFGNSGSNAFGVSLAYSDVNNTSFGVQFVATGNEASANNPVTAYLDYATITVVYSAASENFNYLKTFEDSFGNISTLALDAGGTLWREAFAWEDSPTDEIAVATGQLATLLTGPPPNSFARSFTAESREYIAFSDLFEGTYPPIQYTGEWIDRIGQVGPGAPPQFKGTLQSGSVATLTAYSISSNIVTLTISPALATAFTAGEVVTFSVSAGPTFLNGLSLSVLGTGLSASGFEVAYAVPNGSGSATGTASPQYTYPIQASPAGITQYPAYPVPGSAGSGGGFDEITLSSGPGSLQAGNVLTFYYAVSGPDNTLVNAFQQGLFPVYVYISGAPAGNGTQLVTNVGLATPPGLDHERFYFTVNQNTTGKINYGNPSPGSYQMTIATLATALPLPGVETGDQITLSGNAISSWNASWNVVQALDSGSYEISSTVMAAGVATYGWQLSGATPTPPVAGQLVTVSGTLNGSGIFNVTDAAIGAVTGTSSGTFTVAGFAGNLAFSSQTEVGQATTSGTQFQIDPGPLTLGGTADPIYGNSGGGSITLVGSTSVVVGTGTRRGVVFFITRNGYYTAPSPYVQFNITDNTNYVLASSIPIGPPSVIARGIAFTEAGSNNVPGASYYTIPEPVQFVLDGTTYTSSALIVNDNTTTSAKFTFTDAVLLNAEEIDIQGADLFNLEELGDCAWGAQYAGRAVFGRVRNKIGNFLNLSFDGGYNPNPGANLVPLGWSLDTNYGFSQNSTLLVSPVYGNSYYIENQIGASLYGLITQSAYQDQNNVAILQPNTLYSARVTCRGFGSGGATSGELVIDLCTVSTFTIQGSSGPYTITTYDNPLGMFSLPVTSMTTAMATYEGALLTTALATVPSSLLLRMYASNLPSGGSVEIDRIEIFPTLAPTNLTQLAISYKDDLEAFDAVTGFIETSAVNSQPANGAAVINDQLYVFKESSMGYIADSPGQEPQQWNPYREVSNIAGACGIHAYDLGENWAVMACRKGLYAFNGGAPKPLHLEIPDIWNSIYWEYGHTIVVRNDTAAKRILVAVPMALPNQWIPYPPASYGGAPPTSPNVVLMLNYAGIGSIDELMESMALHTTMTGKLAVHDLRRKWSIWTIAAPCMEVCKRSNLDETMLIGNGYGNSLVYSLDENYPLDDVAGGGLSSSNIPWLYTTYGFIDEDQAEQDPIFGKGQKRFTYLDALMSGSGTAQIRLLQNTAAINVATGSPSAPYPYVVPGGAALPGSAANNLEFPLDELAMRLFVEISANAVPGLPQSSGCFASISRVSLVGGADNWSPIRGV